MRHLFIINPTLDGIKNKAHLYTDDLKTFFESNSEIGYDYHITRWSRDAVGYVRRYVSASNEMVRVHVFGGTGTLFEVVNGVVGLPNAQVAAYPMGRTNNFLRYFGQNKTRLFMSVRNQVFSGVTSIDVIRCGNNYALTQGLVGVESAANRNGSEMIDKTNLPTDFCYLWSAAVTILKSRKLSQTYRIMLDGTPLDGDYLSIMVAGSPCYGKNMSPAVDAHPNDGLLDVYLTHEMTKAKIASVVSGYVSGYYYRYPKCFSHYRGSKITISSDTVMCMSIDGEAFYDTTVEFEIIPYAIDLVCPSGIDIGKLPRIFNRPEEGLRGEE